MLMQLASKYETKLVLVSRRLHKEDHDMSSSVFDENLSDAEQNVLDRFLEFEMHVDKEWLSPSPQGTTYFFADLAAHFTISRLEDERGKIGFHISLVSEIKDFGAAYALCAELNKETGWGALHVDVENKSIDLILALCTELDDDALWSALGFACQTAFNFALDVSNSLAEATQGIKAIVCHPTLGMRHTPDYTCQVLTARRNRPEWVFDPSSFAFPPEDEVLEYFATVMNGGEEGIHQVIAVGDGRLVVAPIQEDESFPYMVRPAFVEHDYLGTVFQVDVPFFNEELDHDHSVALADSRNILTFLRPDGTLLGSWITNGNVVAYRTRFSSSVLLGFQANPRNVDLYGTSKGLWELVKASESSLEAHQRVGRPTLHDQWSLPDCKEVAREMGSLPFERAVDSLTTSSGESHDGEVANRDLLWLQDPQYILHKGFFNPMGPALESFAIERFSNDDTYVLVRIMRHPFAPEFEVIGVGKSKSELVATLGQFMKANWLNIPTFIWNPGEVDDQVTSLLSAELWSWITEFAQVDLDEVLKSTKRLQAFDGNPWSYLDAEIETSELSKLSAEDLADAYLACAMNSDLIFAFLMGFSSAWDGAINFQRGSGNLQFFDIGPIPLVYSQMGRPDIDTSFLNT